MDVAGLPFEGFSQEPWAGRYVHASGFPLWSLQAAGLHVVGSRAMSFNRWIVSSVLVQATQLQKMNAEQLGRIDDTLVRSSVADLAL